MIIWGGVGLYLVVLLVFGLLASRKVKDITDFILAGRRLPLSLCTFTLFATWFGAGTCIGAAGAAYEKGLLGVIADPFGAGLCLLLAGFFYMRVLRRMRLLTLPDLFRSRFGPRAEIVASLSILPAYMGWVGAQFVGFGYILHTLTGIDTQIAIFIGAAVVLTYTVAGGMWAVTITDFIQGVILIAGLLLLLPLVFQDAGGWSGLRSQIPEGTFSMLPQNSWKDWMWYIEAWLVIGIGSIPTPDLFQRGLSARNEWVAQWSAYLAGAMYFTVGMVPVALGILGAVVMPDIADPEFILPALGLKYLHPLAMAVFVGALFSALMSSADSGLLAPASVFGQNILKNLKGGISQKRLLWSVRWAVVGTGLLALMTALYFQAVYDLMVNSWAVLMVSLFVPLTAALYWKKANEPAAVASMLVGMTSWILLAWLQSSYPADLMATGLGALTLVVVALATGKRRPPLPLVDSEGRRVAYRDRLGVLGFKYTRLPPT